MPGTANSGGRNAKPPQMHVLTGTFRDDRHGGSVSPEPPKGRPVAPKGLVGPAKAEWERMVSRLEDSGTLTLVDDAALYQYVQLFAETESINVRAAENARLTKKLMAAVQGLDGAELVEAVKQIVELRYLDAKDTRDLRQGHMAIRGYLVEFGMTPAARSRVKVPTKGKAQSAVDAFRSAKSRPA